eukprot:1963339-Pleurochrysis_carterae.AAC.3
MHVLSSSKARSALRRTRARVAIQSPQQTEKRRDGLEMRAYRVYRRLAHCEREIAEMHVQAMAWKHVGS